MSRTCPDKEYSRYFGDTLCNRTGKPCHHSADACPLKEQKEN